jgi:hypothetical protein
MALLLREEPGAAEVCLFRLFDCLSEKNGE